MTPTRLNPFPGLRPFQVEEEFLFFGREEQRRDLVSLLRTQRFIAVLGASGSGKSSLVRAGLLPALYGGLMTQAGSHWKIALMRPGGDPMRHLAEALLAAEVWDECEPRPSALELETTLSRSGLGLVEAVRQSRLPANQNLLVVVDQFEELFRFQQSQANKGTRDEAAAFVNLLLEAIRQQAHSIFVVLTMRSDFFGDCSQFEELAGAINRGEYLVPRLTRAQKKQAIEGPVKVGGAQVAPRLLQRLLGDLGDDPDHLPILQHALMRTWDHWAKDHAEGEPLDLRHYESIGGMAAALSRHADELFASLENEEQREVAAKVFKALTERGADNRGIRRPTTLKRLCAISGSAEGNVCLVVDAFRRSGCTFLMPPESVPLESGSVVDISHESLMRVWWRLKDWVEEESQSARIYQRLADTAQLHAEGRAGWYHDPDLQIALSWRDSYRPTAAWAERYHVGFERALAFLDESQQAAAHLENEREAARQRQLEQARLLAASQARIGRGFKRFGMAMAVLVLVVIGLTLSALNASNRAREQSARLRILSYGANLHNALYLHETVGNGGRANQALTNCPVEMRDWGWNHLKAVVDQTDRILATGLENVFIAVFSPDGSKVLSGRRNGLYQLWEVATGRELNRFEMSPSAMNEKLPDPAFMPDGRQVVLCDETRMIVWDTLTAQPLQTYAPMRPLAVFVGTNRFLSLHRPLGNAVTNAQVWDHAAGRLLSVLTPYTRGSRTAIFSPDGSRVIQRHFFWGQFRYQETVSTYDTATGNQLLEIPSSYPQEISELAFSPRGILASCESAGNVEVWNALDGTAIAELTFPNSLQTVAFSSDGGNFVVAGSLGSLWLYDVASQKQLGTYRGHASKVLSARFSPDDQWIVSTSDDGTIRLWQSEPYDATMIRLSLEYTSDVAFSPDGKEFAVVNSYRDSPYRASPWGTMEGFVAIVNSENLGETACFWDPSKPARQLAYSPDGTWLATLFQDGSTLVLRDRTHDYQSVQMVSAPTRVVQIAFTPDSQRLVGLGRRPEYYVWNARDGALLQRQSLDHTTSDLSHFALSPNANLMAISLRDDEGRIQVRNLSSGQLIHTMQDAPVSYGRLAFSPDGRWLATGGNDNLARVWDVSTGKVVQRFRGHTEPVLAVAFSPSGQRLATGANDDTVKLWNVATGEDLLGWFPNVASVVELAFSPDNRSLFICGEFSQAVLIESALPSREARQRRRSSAQLDRKLASLTSQADAPTVVLERLLRDPDATAEVRILGAQICSMISSMIQARSSKTIMDYFFQPPGQLGPRAPSLLLRSQRFAENTQEGWTDQAREDWDFLKAQPESYLYSSQAMLIHFTERFLVELAKKAETGLSAKDETGLLAILLYQAYQAHEVHSPPQNDMDPLLMRIQTLMNSAPLIATLVPKGAVWRYLDDGSDQGEAWRSSDFSDASWREGPADFAFIHDAAANAKTRIRYGEDGRNKHVTAYFRHTLPWNDDVASDRLLIHLRRDDGAVVYVNGKEVVRDNMPEGDILFDTRANVTASNENETNFFTHPVPRSVLRPGTNLIAVEIHQVNPNSSDLHFDLELIQTSSALRYLGSLPAVRLRDAVSQVLAWLPQALQGAWARQFEFSFAADSTAFPSAVESDLSAWETRARLQAAMQHPLAAVEACQASLRLLTEHETDPSLETRKSKMRLLLEQLNGLSPNPVPTP